MRVCDSCGVPINEKSSSIKDGGIIKLFAFSMSYNNQSDYELCGSCLHQIVDSINMSILDIRKRRSSKQAALETLYSRELFEDKRDKELKREIVDTIEELEKREEVHPIIEVDKSMLREGVLEELEEVELVPESSYNMETKIGKLEKVKRVRLNPNSGFSDSPS